MKRVLFLALIFMVIISACSGTPPAPQVNGQPSEIRDPEVGDTYEELTNQIERTYNCDGLSPTTIFQRALEQEQTTIFEVVIEAGGLIRGTPIPEVLEVQLESKIKSALSRNQGVKYLQSVTQPIETPKGQAFEHTITWKETKIKGLIEVVYQDKTAKLSFQKIIGIQLYGLQSQPIACPSQIATAAPVATSAPSTEPSSNGSDVPTIDRNLFLTRSVVDTLFGAGNWSCFPDREDGIAIRRVPPSFVVTSPVRSIVTYRGEFGVGKLAPQLGATAELEKPVPQQECPANQLQALSDWTKARSADTQPYDRSRIDSLFGAGNWKCVNEFSFAITVNKIPQDYRIEYPVTFISNLDSTNWGVGETIPGNQQGTVWLGGSIPKDQCP